MCDGITYGLIQGQGRVAEFFNFRVCLAVVDRQSHTGLIFNIYLLDHFPRELAVKLVRSFRLSSSQNCARFDYEVTDSRMLVQKEGVEKVLGLGKMLDSEVNAVKQGLPELQKNIKKGEEFVEKNPPANI